MRRRWVKRAIDQQHAERKQRISNALLFGSSWHIGGPWYQHLHQYSKGKIHCSCPMCRSKTNDRHGLPGPAMNWPARDLRRLEAMRYDTRG